MALHAAKHKTAGHQSLAYECASLKEVFLDQIRVLKAAGWGNCLVNNPSSFPELATAAGASRAYISNEMRASIGNVKRGDLLFASSDQSRMMTVVACYSVDNDLGVIYRDCECIRHLTSKCSVFDIKPQLDYKILSEIDWMQRVKAWPYQSSHRVVALKW